MFSCGPIEHKPDSLFGLFRWDKYTYIYIYIQILGEFFTFPISNLGWCSNTLTKLNIQTNSMKGLTHIVWIFISEFKCQWSIVGHWLGQIPICASRKPIPHCPSEAIEMLDTLPSRFSKCSFTACLQYHSNRRGVGFSPPHSYQNLHFYDSLGPIICSHALSHPSSEAPVFFKVLVVCCTCCLWVCEKLAWTSVLCWQQRCFSSDPVCFQRCFLIGLYSWRCCTGWLVW